MSNKINLLAFGTFGNPHGFRQTFFSGNKEFERDVKTFDLNTNAIRLFPNSSLYLIRKENINSSKAISYALYNFAKEQNSERSGTFIGSSIIYVDEIAEETLTVKVLNEFNESVVSRNVDNNIIRVNHSDNLSVIKPNDLDKLLFNLKSIEDIVFGLSSNKSALVYADIKSESITSLFQKSTLLLDKFDAIYFTNSNEIAEYVYQKGLYKLMKVDAFEQEIAIVVNERKQKVINSISEFEREKQLLFSDKEFVTNEMINQQNLNLQTHIENQKILDEAKFNLDKITSFYNEFSRKLDEYSNQLKSGSKLEHVRNLYNENKRIFINSVSELKQPQYIKKLPKIKPTSNLKIEEKKSEQRPQQQQVVYDEIPSQRRGRQKQPNNIILLIVGLLIVCVIIFLSYKFFTEYASSGNTEKIINEQPIVNNPEPQKKENQSLNPIPNSQLNPNDLKLLTKQKLKGKAINEIVALIFQKNKNDVANTYSNQLNQYTEEVLKKNNGCFDNSRICICDSLTYVPIFKNQ